MQAGIAKTGAAWLPFDADTPVDRIAVCLADANAIGILSCAEFEAQLHHRVIRSGSQKLRRHISQKHGCDVAPVNQIILPM
jgi:non-ribosomal peptide synthetase component F